MFQLDPREFIQIFTTPDAIDREQYICVHYNFVPGKGLTLEQSAARVATVTSLRTMAPLPYELRAERVKHTGCVLSVRENGQVIIGYPLDICTVNEGLTHLLLVLSMGAEYGSTNEFWVEQIEFPKCFLERFKGPKFGSDGIRKRFKIPTRPLLGVYVSPRYGVSLAKIAEQCRESLLGGADYITDDILLVDPDGDMAFKRRVPVLAKIASEASAKTGEQKWYAANIGTSPKKTLEYAKIAQAEGVGAIKVNAFTMGFSTVEELRNESEIDLPIINTNMGFGILTRPRLVSRQSTGMSEAVVSKLSRLAGADALHVGTLESGLHAQQAWHPALVAIKIKLHNIKSAFIVAGEELTVANVWENICSYGPDVMLEPEAGVLAYPGGPHKGAQAFRTIVNNVTFDMSPEEAHTKIMDLAQHNACLRQGLDYYRYSPKTMSK